MKGLKVNLLPASHGREDFFINFALLHGLLRVIRHLCQVAPINVVKEDALEVRGVGLYSSPSLLWSGLSPINPTFRNILRMSHTDVLHLFTPNFND